MPASVMRLRSTIQQRLFTIIYHQGSIVYDKLTDWLFLGEWTRWQDSALAYLPPHAAILELGCGTGSLARRASDAGWRWVALDLSAAMVARTRHRIDLGHTAVIRADARLLPFAAQSFDAIVATFPAPFIFASGMSREIARVLRPGGLAVIVISAELLGNHWRHRWRCRLLDLFYGASTVQAVPSSAFPGFSQTVIEHETASGRAHLVLLRLNHEDLVHSPR